MRPRLLLLLSLIPLAVQAQTLNITLGDGTTSLTDGGTGSAGFINATQCGDAQLVTYKLTGAACSAMNLWLTAGSSCGTGADAGDYSIGTVAAATVTATPTGTFTFSGGNLPTVGGDGGTCGAAGVTQTFLVCGSFGYQGAIIGGTCTLTAAATEPTFTYDSEPPATPTLSGVESLDQALRLDYSVTDSDTASILAQIRVVPAGATTLADGGLALGDGGAFPGAPDFTAAGTFPTTGAISITDLNNDSTYQVRIAGQDSAQNTSGFSSVQQGTPAALYGFWDNYIKAGGSPNGGCSSFGGPLWMMAVMPALYSLLRRRR